MGIVIPINEANWISFYYKAKKAGGNVVSRYKGVYISTANKLPQFMTSYQHGRSRKFLGRFPLTKEGEETAFKVYKEYIASIPTSDISNRPGRVIKDKIK